MLVLRLLLMFGKFSGLYFGMLLNSSGGKCSREFTKLAPAFLSFMSGRVEFLLSGMREFARAAPGRIRLDFMVRHTLLALGISPWRRPAPRLDIV